MQIMGLEFYEAFEQMAAGLAHEVRNPLSLVQASIALLELNETADDIRRRYSVMRRELDRANCALTELMHLAKPAPHERDRTPLSLNELLCRLIDTLRSAYGNAVTFALDSAAGDYIIRADKESLLRLFHNVLKNAIESVTEARTDGSGLIHLALAATDGFITITITDNGCGLTEEENKHASEPFFTTKACGTGLGLHISRAAAEAHGGTLTIQGTAGIGCTVTIRLPLMS